MPETIAQDTTADLEQLNALLDQAEAADAASATSRPDAASLTQPEPDQAAQSPEPSEPAKDANAGGEPKPEPPKDTSKDKPTETPEPEKAKSRYAKELERQERSWKAINERKAELEKREAELARREAELQAKATAAPKYTAEQYERAADVFEQQGKYDLAEAAREEAKRLRENPRADAEAQARQAALEHKQGLEASWARVKAEMPEALDKSHPFNKALMEFIKAEPGVMDYPNGPYLAAQYVKVKLSADEAGKWKSEAETLRAKVRELEARVTVPGGGVNQIPKPKAFEDMTLEEQGRELDRLYREQAA